MAQSKSASVDAFISKPEKDIPFVLLYGPDEGLVSERADNLAKNYSLESFEPPTQLRFELEEIASQPGKLADEAFAISMFSNLKIIRLRGTTRKNILPAIKVILETPPTDCWIICEAGDLKRDSGLRKLIEKSTAGMALPCFQDNASALNQLIREEITANGFQMDPETTDMLRTMLGSDRRASRGELKKLALYAHGQSSISKKEILELMGNVSLVEIDDIVDAVGTGNTGFLESKLDRLSQSGVNADMIILATLRHFQLLHKFSYEVETRKENPASLIASARPPIHFSRRPAMANMLKAWQLEKLNLALDRLNKAFFETRSKPELARSIAATTLLAIALLAKRPKTR